MTRMIYFSKLCSLILLILFSFAGYCPNWVHTGLNSINNIGSSGEIAIAEKKIEARRITPWHFYAHLSFACTLLFIANWPFSWLEIDLPDTRFICSREWEWMSELASGNQKTPAAKVAAKEMSTAKPRPRAANGEIASTSTQTQHSHKHNLVHFCPFSFIFSHVHCTCFLFLGIDY